MITLSDIAAACGVSRTTVSRVLSQDPEFSVSNQTRDLILSTVKAMNYDMSQKRRIPGSKETKASSNQQETSVLKVGILNCEFKLFETAINDYYNIIFSGLMSCLKDMNLISDMEFRYILKESYEEFKGLDALIILGKLKLNPCHPLVHEIKYKIILDYIAPDHLFDSILPDFDQAIQMAVDYFHSIGHQDIGYIGSTNCIVQFALNSKEEKEDFRHLAFQNYCLQNGIDPKSRIWLADSFTPEDGYAITNRLVNENKLPPALLYGSDGLAMGAYKAFQEHGIKVGESISVIGIDNMPFSGFLNPPLTTIALNPQLLGRAAAHALISQFRQHRDYPLTMHPPLKMVVRNSCKKLL